VAYLFVLFTLLTKPFATFVVFPRYDGNTARSARAQRLLVSVFLLVPLETRLAPKVSVAIRARVSNPRGYTWWTRHTFTASVITRVFSIVTTTLNARVTQNV
jgi:hypothetical protein